MPLHPAGQLDFPRDGKTKAFLVFCLALVVQSCMIAQHLAARPLVAIKQCRKQELLTVPLTVT
ncbi:hypothetical protein [Rhodoferax ferrireducens]|uniref:hypothetical protein n=1 Tax=Rhodoferax ferrireducens TaxID=192843 RepID=UPI0002D6B07B|nr:hypothetical protein [Rhodoferax ferrireducens]